PQHGGFADARPAQQQNAFARLDDVPDDVDGAEHRPADAARQAHDVAFAVADGRDAVQRGLDAGPVVVAELADPAHHVVDVLPGHGLVATVNAAVGEAGFGPPPQVQHDFQKLGQVVQADEHVPHAGRQHVQQLFQVVDDFFALGHESSPRPDDAHGGSVPLAQQAAHFAASV